MDLTGRFRPVTFRRLTGDDVGSKIFDIGANIGWYSIHIAKNLQKCKVYAFEPIPDTFKQLQQNALNDAEGAHLQSAYNLLREHATSGKDLVVLMREVVKELGSTRDLEGKMHAIGKEYRVSEYLSRIQSCTDEVVAKQKVAEELKEKAKTNPLVQQYDKDFINDYSPYT